MMRACSFDRAKRVLSFSVLAVALCLPSHSVYAGKKKRAAEDQSNKLIFLLPLPTDEFWIQRNTNGVTSMPDVLCWCKTSDNLPVPTGCTWKVKTRFKGDYYLAPLSADHNHWYILQLPNGWSLTLGPYSVNWQNRFGGGDLVVECASSGYQPAKVVCKISGRREQVFPDPVTGIRSDETIRGYFQDVVLSVIAHHESYGGKQFTSGGEPFPNSSHDGGYGVMQVTNPQPTVDELFSWKANCDRGREIYNQKYQAAVNYLVPWDANVQGESLEDATRYEAVQSWRGGHYYVWTGNMWDYAENNGYADLRMPDVEAIEAGNAPAYWNQND